MLKIGHFKHLNKLKKQLLKHRIQIINIREKTSYSKIDHPSDTLALKVPEPDDGTEWISPELPEYLQIRQKLRSSSEDFFRDMSMMPFEARFREDLEKEHYYKYDFEGDLSAEAQFASKMTFGTGSQKAGLLRKRIESKILGMFDTETPLKALRQLKVLVPYLGVKDPEEFIYEMKNAAIMATCKLRKAKDAINKTIEAKQKVLKEKFDNDAFKLIEEVEELKTKISEDQNYLENSCVQEALRKWHLLKIDFGDKKIGEGIVIEQNLKVGPGEHEPMPTKEVYKLSGYSLTETMDENNFDSFFRLDMIDYNRLKEIREDLIDFSKHCFDKNEAIALLSDDSVLGLIESMRAALAKAHSLLLLNLETELHEAANESTNTKIYEDHYQEERDVHIEKMKVSRLYDPAVRLRYWLRDDFALKSQRAIKLI